MKANAPLAKLDIASVYGTEGQRFESPTARHKTQYIVVLKKFTIYCVFIFSHFRGIYKSLYWTAPAFFRLYKCIHTCAVHTPVISAFTPHSFVRAANVWSSLSS